MDMKKILGLTIFLLLSLWTMAQTQLGIVKTRGRMVNGVLQKGTPLAGVTIQIKGLSAVVSKSDGSFSFPVSGQSYLLQSVKKQGYQLVNMDTCHTYQYSATPLYLVMETPEQIMDDLLVAERKIRRNLQKQLQQKEDEIEALNISSEEKDKRLLQLYQQHSEKEKLIGDMAKRFAEMDYDQLDDLHRKINDAIINGHLKLADSLLRSKGGNDARGKGLYP